MAKRRPSGDGSIRRREDGRWEGRIVVGHKKNGSPIFRYVLAPTQKELLDKLHRNIELYRGVELVEDCRLTLSEWLDRWLASYAAGTVRESTLAGHKTAVNLYIKPRLGGKKLNSITTEDVQRMYTALKKSGRVRNHPEFGHRLSDGMICRIHYTLHRALDNAVAAHLIPSNPTDGAVVPKPNSKPMQILNEEQLERFMKEIKKDPLWYDFFYTELTTGLRRGEICGLRWEDFDGTAGVLSVRRTIRREKGDGFTTGETKTGTGKRKIILPPSTSEILEKRRKKSRSDWIFPDPLKPELPISPAAAYSQLKRLLEQAGLPSIRFHDLRHTFCTHALASGVDAKTLSGILGHTNASFTLDTYTHVTGDMQKRAAVIVGDFMEDLFGKELKPWRREESAAKAAST